MSDNKKKQDLIITDEEIRKNRKEWGLQKPKDNPSEEEE
jgi:hypothetical protein